MRSVTVDFLSRRDHHFLAIGLVAVMHAPELVQAARQARHVSGLPFDSLPISAPSIYRSTSSMLDSTMAVPSIDGALVAPSESSPVPTPSSMSGS